MEKKIINVTVSVAIINTLSMILHPVSTQQILTESIYLKTLKETISIRLS